MTSGLVLVQIALSLLVVVGAGLFVNTFERLARVALGFDQHQWLSRSHAQVAENLFLRKQLALYR